MGFCGVGGDLGLQGVEAGEAALLADVGVQRHRQFGVVDVGIEVEDVDLEPAFRALVHRRAAADVRDTVAPPAVWQPDRHRIDAARGLQVAAEGDVGGGEADRAAARVAVRDGAADGPGAAEIGGGAFGIAVLQHAADARGGDRAGAVGEQRHQGQPHAERFGARGEEVGAAAAAPTEGEVRAAHQMARAETLVQHLGHEGLGRHQAEFVVEGQLVEQGDAQRLECRGALGRQREAERRVVGAEVLARMRLEGQHAEGQLRPRRVRGLDHLGMAAMHAVEIAQRHDGAACIGGKLAPVVEDADHDRDGTWT